ncbi:hypothetical protein [Methanospirillum sp.]|uniref:hypothetical protein n=1 Tax=Methanospirillum sp. TaxID=45200 RepID=UPI002BD00418|nr:hypothetical protein [Methanospirillum sp.]HOL40238.1 hypothetical protein [Methanospirillum sp.]HPP77028.1 hypothetical protein [Methanospirillum sp.]
MIRYCIVLLVLIAGVFISGCVSNAPAPSPVSEIPATDVPTENPPPQGTPVVENLSEEPTVVSTQEIPTPLVTTEVPQTIMPTPTADPNSAFHDMVITRLDLIQEGKKKVLSAWEAADPALTGSRVEELRHAIRNNNDGSTFPKKMDYVRLNYYDFIDRMTQFADTFKEAASLMERGENGSAQSYAAAGVMAGDRADISDKRIRVFLRDHPNLL